MKKKLPKTVLIGSLCGLVLMVYFISAWINTTTKKIGLEFRWYVTDRRERDILECYRHGNYFLSTPTFNKLLICGPDLKDLLDESIKLLDTPKTTWR